MGGLASQVKAGPKKLGRSVTPKDIASEVQSVLENASKEIDEITNSLRKNVDSKNR